MRGDLTRGLAAECEQARQWLSAHRDAEAGDDRDARRHIDGCPSCGRWVGQLDRLSRLAGVRAADGPDVVAPALAAWSAPVRRGGQERVARLVLAVAGVSGLVLAGLGLLDVAGYVEQAGLHLGWELYSFEAALAVGFLIAARSPGRYLAGLLPVTLAVALLGLVPAAAFVAAGGDLLREASHVPVLVGLAGLLLQADAQGGLRAGTSRRPGRQALA